MLFPLVPLAALATAVAFWALFIYHRRTVLRSEELRALGVVVCVNATGVLLVLALLGSQEYLAGLVHGSPVLQSIATEFCS